jgi:hypothetical protein
MTSQRTILMTPISRTTNVAVPLVVFTLLFTSLAFASIFGSVRGVLHDPQHRPIKEGWSC